MQQPWSDMVVASFAISFLTAQIAPSTSDLICTCLKSEHTNTALIHNFSPHHQLSVFVQHITLFLLALIARQAAACLLLELYQSSTSTQPWRLVVHVAIAATGHPVLMRSLHDIPFSDEAGTTMSHPVLMQMRCMAIARLSYPSSFNLKSSSRIIALAKTASCLILALSAEARVPA